MVLESLRKALFLLSSLPVLWVSGVAIGLFGVMDIAAQFYFGEFVAGRMWIIELIAVPFFVAATMQVIRNGQGTLRAFFAGGVKYYFRILIPTVVIAFAVLLTVILLVIPLSVIGTALEAVPFIIAGCAVGISFFTFFYDAAAAFEDAKVFESIRRSVEVVVRNPGRVILFYLVLLAVCASILLVFALVWVALLYDSLLPLTTMDTATIEAFTPDDLTALIGPGDLAVTAILYMAAIMVVFPFVYTYKSTFFQKITQGTGVFPQGEFDDRGRWYKY